MHLCHLLHLLQYGNMEVSTSLTSTTATVSGTDLAGNAYSGTESLTFTITDSAPPTVSLIDNDSDNVVVNSDAVIFTATFSSNDPYADN